MKRKFNFTEGELYSLCLTGWDTCIKFLSFITAFSPKYTADYVAGKKMEVLLLMKKFNQGQRSSNSLGLRGDLFRIGEKALKVWESLKLYVEEAFAPEELESRLGELGGKLFKTGSKKQWRDLSKMLLAGQQFLEVHRVKLLENKNMPEDFPQLYDEVLNEFHEIWGSYLQKGLDKLISTEEHTKALNKIYSDVSKMFAVGRVVFKENKTLKNQFRFARNLKVISGTGWSGIKGKILDEDGRLRVINDLEILVKETADVISQEDDGSYLINHLPADSYTLIITALGYKPVEKVVEVKVDNYTTVDLVMEKENSDSEDEAV